MSWRIELLVRLPWIERLAEGQTCDEYRWSRMSIKASRSPELKERYRCRRVAFWRFTGLKPRKHDWIGQDVGRSGVYCYSHLVNQAFLPEREEIRYVTWCQKNYDLVQRVKSGVEPKLIKRVRNRAAHDISDEA